MQINATRERLVARLVLAAVVATLVALIAIPGEYFNASAQTAVSPTPSPTGQTIELLNPDSSSSNIVADGPDGTDSRYHLNAWVGQVPPNPTVEFQITGNNQDVTIVATPKGTDTFEAFYDIPDNFADGTYTLTAKLFEGSGETSALRDTDTQEIVINNKAEAGTPVPVDDTAAANTIEITYPTNAGPLGVFRTSPSNVSNFIIEGTSVVAGSVTPKYSVEAAGSPPAYRNCANGASTVTAGAFRIRCELTEADRNRPVSAVAVVAPTANAGTPANPAPGSADGHRVFSYEQVPSGIAVRPAQVSNADITKCVAFEATVTDQQQRPIARANVDVHATGPTDNLRFDTSAQSDPNQPPDFRQGGSTSPSASGSPTSSTSPTSSGSPTSSTSPTSSSSPTSSTSPTSSGSPSGTASPSGSPTQSPSGSASPSGSPTDPNGHTADPAFDCSTNANAKTQGEHDRAAAEDNKHIESTPTGASPGGGTNNAGTFKFQLRTDAPGTTQVTAWADTVDNDGFDSNEPCGNASIGWGQAAPQPTGGSPEFEGVSCVGGATTSPSPSNTPSQSASPTQTSSPTPVDCNDGVDNDNDNDIDFPEDRGCSSSTDTTEEGETVEVDSTLSIGYKAGRDLFKGAISSDNESCEAGRTVVVKKVRKGRKALTIGADATNQAGAYKIKNFKKRTGRFFAKVKPVTITSDGQTINCTKARSRTIRVRRA